jgi:putative MFS transporter
MLVGYLTDRIGWQFVCIADLIALALFSILSAFAGEAWQLVILRFLLGVAIGADYPVATSLLAEYSPKKYRGFLWRHVRGLGTTIGPRTLHHSRIRGFI